MNNLVIVIGLVLVIIVVLLGNSSKFSNSSNISGGTNIGIITLEDRQSKYLEYHNTNLNNYSKKYNYDYLYVNDSYKEINVYWRKIYKVLELLPNYDYVVWLDSDTIITQNIPLEKYINKYNKDIIIGVDCWDQCSRINKINAGVFIIKNSELSFKFLKECVDIHSLKIAKCEKDNKIVGSGWAGECYEQGVMNELLLYNDNYKNNVYVDYDQEFIYNYSVNRPRNYENTNALIVHLCISSSNERENFFSKFI
jgi:hypothetical protein